MRYRGRKAKSFIDWDTIDYVVGTRDDVTSTGIHRPCHRCGQNVFTSRHYPERVSMMCDVCALAVAKEEEAAGREMTATIAGLPDPELLSSLDPWRRMVEAGSGSTPDTLPTKNTLAPTRRRSRPRSNDGGQSADK